MSPRQRRIEKILTHRKQELDNRVAALIEAKQREAAALAVANAARVEVRAAQAARRELSERGSNVQAFIEAEDWLSTTAIRAQRAWHVVMTLREEVSRVQATVLEARMKLRQAEHLSARVVASERKAEDRRERRRDDEDAARIAQRRTSAGQAGDE